MLPAVNGKRLASGAFSQVIGEFALRALQQYPLGMQTATCRRAHAAPVASLATTIFTQGRTQNVPFAFSAPSLRKRQNCDAHSAICWCEQRPRLTCSPQAQAYAAGAIKRTRCAREHALDATNNWQSKTSTTRTFPHMTPRK